MTISSKERAECERSAQEFADRRWPTTKFPPSAVGFIGLCSISIVMVIIKVLRGQSNMTELNLAELIIVVLAFLIPFVFVRFNRRKNTEFFRRENQRLIYELERKKANDIHLIPPT